MLTVHTLASGSEGNCLLLHDGKTHILVDAGISCRRITNALSQLGLSMERVDAVCITHEHSDHIGGLAVLTKKYRIPVYASAATARQLAYRMAGIEPLLRCANSGDVFSVGTIRVRVFYTSHDAADSVDYRFDAQGSVGVLTDTGYVTDEAREALQGVDVMVLESNHDVAMLRAGPYPYRLQQRILGDCGHLSNDTAARFAYELAQGGTHTFVLAHLSRENNLPTLALETVCRAVDGRARVFVAPRAECSEAYRTEVTRCSE